jgi:hypothetical protein
MAITKDDLKLMFDKQNQELGDKFSDAVAAVSAATAAVSRRTAEIETVVTSQVLLARNKIVHDAEKAFATATHQSFEESAVMLSPNGPGRKQDGSRDNSASIADLISDTAFAAVSSYVDTTFSGKYTVELTKKGFRMKHNSRSSQVCRADAAQLIKDHRKDFTERFGLYMHFDRTFEYRMVVKNALSFLRILKSGCPAVEKYAVVNGVCQINEIAVAPAALIPTNNAVWEGLATLIAKEVPGLRMCPAQNGSQGVLYDQVADYFALAAGVRFLPPAETATAV